MTEQYPEYPYVDQPDTWEWEASNDLRGAGGRHRVNVGHLVMGVAFLNLVGIWALVTSGAVAADGLRWLLPVPWVVAGVVGLAAGVVAARRRGRPHG